LDEPQVCVLDPADYEALVAQLAEELIDGHAEAKRTAFGRSNKLRGASGFEHQIDVSVHGDSFIYLAECKCWNSSVPVEKVLAFACRCADIQEANRETEVIGAIVTTKGFQADAKSWAHTSRLNSTSCAANASSPCALAITSASP
jgi:hypothetical protein